MYKNMISLLCILLLSGCSLFQIHRQNIEQGNLITEEKVQQLHTGMTESHVKTIMGTPMLVNIFESNRVHYIYTMQKGNTPWVYKRVSLLFDKGKLVNITR